MEQLINEIKLKLIDALNLDGMTPADIDDHAPLFGDEGLGLDSIDVLELIVLLERNYGIRLANPQEGKKVFQSVAVMADYVAANRSGAAAPASPRSATCVRRRRLSRSGK